MNDEVFVYALPIFIVGVVICNWWQLVDLLNSFIR